MTTGVAKTMPAHGRNQVPPILLTSLILGVLVVVGLGHTYGLAVLSALVWGLALYVSGALIGFLFGIPKIPDRSGQGKVSDASAGASSPDAADSVKRVETEPRRVSGINSNLVEVSDWLTKIIVGVGLVELKNLSTYGQSLAEFIARSLTPPLASEAAAATKAASAALTTAAQLGLTSIGGAIALFFGVLGFITGYLLTRIFLAVIMNDADRSAEEVSSWRLEGGGVVDTPTILGSLKSAIDDLQAKVVGLLSPARPEPPAAPAAGAGAVDSDPAAQDSGVDDEADSVNEAPKNDASPPAPVRRVSPPLTRTLLWVDDQPGNNALIIDRLVKVGVTVDTALTTSDALMRLRRSDYDVVISDMHRGEKINDGSPSGIRLIKALRNLPGYQSRAGRQPLVGIYCARSSLARYGAAALKEGADFATASEVDLLGVLSSVYTGLA